MVTTPASVAIVAPAVNLGTDPGGAFVMLATANTAQTTLFAAMAARIALTCHSGDTSRSS